MGKNLEALPDIDLGIVKAAGDTKLAEALLRVQYIIDGDSECVSKNKAKPTKVDKLLRIGLWDEYTRVQVEGGVIRSTRIWAGVCSENYYLRLLKNDDKMAFIGRPIHNYDLTNKYILYTAQEKLIEIVEAKVVDSNGVLDTKAASAILKAHSAIDKRVKGDHVQRIQTQTQTIPSPKSLREIEQEIAQLESHGTIKAIDAQVVGE